jgi:serine/threonine protein kinase, bacterial
MKISKLYLTIFLVAASCAKDDPKPTPLTIESFSPASVAVGSQIQIRGTGFSSTPTSNSVLFNGVKAQVLTNPSSTSLTVTVPISTSGKITVQVGSQIATSADDFTYAVPTITNFFPKQAGPGQLVTVYIDNYSPVRSENVIKINGVNASFTTVVGGDQSPGTFYITVPLGCGSGFVTIEIGSLKGISSIPFFYRQPLTVTTLAGSTQKGYADGSSARFNAPTGVAVDGSGFFYVADSQNNSIRKVSPTGIATTLAGDGTKGNKNANGFSAQFNLPWSLALDPAGNVFVVDRGNHSIRKITPLGDVTTLAGNGAAGFSNGNGSSAQFNNPHAIAIDKNGNVYVGESNRIRKVTPQGDVTTLAGQGTNSLQFGFIGALTIDPDGNLYAAEVYRVLKITPSGIVSVHPSTVYQGSSNLPTFLGIAWGKDGSLFLSDYFEGKIKKISPSGATGDYAGVSGSGVQDGTNMTATFGYPSGLAIDGSGVLYVADGAFGTNNNSIRKISVN